MARIYLNIPVWLLLFFCLEVFAQNDNAPWSYGLNTYYGGVLRYKPNMPKLDLTNAYGFELYANKITGGNNSWEHLYNYPQVGVALSYFDYGVPDELGQAYSLTSYLDVTTNNKKKNKLRLNIGTGFVYSTKRFDAVTNEENTAISSRISYVVRATIHYEITLSEKYFLNANLAFRHYSNGRLNIPNNGMNFPVAGVGLRYVPSPDKIKFITSDGPYSFNKDIHFNVMGSTSWREVLKEDFKHRAFSLSAYLSKQVSKYNTVLLGVDGFLYDKESVRRATNVYIDQNPGEPDVTDLDGRQLAVTTGGELLFGDLALIFQGGIYVYKPQPYYSNWYQRYGFKYKVTNFSFAQVTLKAHSRTADMMEFGVGFRL